MRCLVQLLGEAVQLNCKPDLRTHGNFQNLLLAPAYHLYQWRNDKQVDTDDRRFFNNLTVKTPHLVDIPKEQISSVMGCEILFNGTFGFGLTYAHVCDGLSISLQSDNCWDAAEIQADVKSLGENIEIETSSTRLKHASLKSHITNHAAWLTERNAIHIQSGKSLWELRSQIMGRLNFCAELQAALESIEENHFCFHGLLKKLKNLQAVASNWNSGSFPHEKIEGNARRDSQTTMDQYGEERKFTCSDGIERTFCWHINLPGEWRLYYEPNDENRTLFIGYIGKHLKTVKFH